MLANDLIQYLSQALYVVVFVLTLVAAIRHRRRVTFEIALLFGAAALSVAITWVYQTLNASPPLIASMLSTALALAIPYLLLRLVNEFAGAPAAIMRLAELGFVVAMVIVLATGRPAPLWATLVLILYFALLTLYVTYAFAREAFMAVSVNARRMAAVAVGCGLLAAAILIAGARVLFPGFEVPFTVLGGPLGLGSGVAFYLGFTTPQWLLRSWREPDLLAFMAQLGELAERQDAPGLIRELQAAVSAALGLRGAFVGLWNAELGVLEYASTRIATLPSGILSPQIQVAGELMRTPPNLLVGGQAFSAQQSVYSEAVGDIDPENADFYRALGVQSVIAVPMTVGEERFGVLGIFSPRRRLFGEDSLTRVGLLAHEAAIMLRTRRLLEQSARVRAQEELAQVKEEFLSAATHDLKTPLTAIKGVAQWAERRAKGDTPIDSKRLLNDLERIQDAAGRMGILIDEMLDISRLQMGYQLELVRTRIELVSLISKVIRRHQEMTSRHKLRLEAPAELCAEFDGPRIERVIDNLLSNAVKYSPEGGEVVVSLGLDDRAPASCVILKVKDQGIGLRAGDLERVFERFERGSNASEQGITGTGVGLAYVRAVVRAHGGQVSVRSVENDGATFTLQLPVSSDLDVRPEHNESEASIEHG